MPLVRSTIYLDPAVRQALRLKAARGKASISEIVNEAVRAALQDDGQDLPAFVEREEEQPMSYETLLARIRADLRDAGSCKTSSAKLLQRWRSLPPVDPLSVRADLDSVADSAL